VLVLPGLGTDDSATRTLRTVLRHLGYRTHGWKLGRNIGPTAAALDGMSTRLARLADGYGQPVSVIGWSLGGMFARRLARRTPESVRQVVTLGSPIRLTHTSQSRAHPLYELFAGTHVERLELQLERGQGPLPVPATSVYSKLDGVVAWRACLDDPAPRAENVAVYASHFGFGHHPAVLWVVADRLGQPAGEWAPFRPPALLRAAYP
jgi:pimeloyl-ACP methyl ester carboxylesterase